MKKEYQEIIQSGYVPDSEQFEETLNSHGLRLQRRTPKTVQLNVGKLCRLSCIHCHVDAGPHRKEMISRGTLEQILFWLRKSPIRTVDLTGGAPELMPDFQWLVSSLKSMGCHVIDRCNLTVLLEPGFEGLAAFLAEMEVEVVASMPCYLPVNVDALRGKGVFDKSIHALRMLNCLGYGEDPALKLTLVHNPNGADLPPNQQELESNYRRELKRHFGIEFNKLYAFTNLPVGRFAAWLKRNGKLEIYMRMLVKNFNPESVGGLMCRHTISVNWEGQAFDCDFNQQMNMYLGENHAPLFLWDVEPDNWVKSPIRTGDHCFGCTAGQGASCNGALSAPLGCEIKKI